MNHIECPACFKERGRREEKCCAHGTAAGIRCVGCGRVRDRHEHYWHCLGSRDIPLYVMWFERDGASTRYTLQFEGGGCSMSITDHERFDMRSPIGAVSSGARLVIEMRASVMDELLWKLIETDFPLYYEIAKDLGWHAHRPFTAS